MLAVCGGGGEGMGDRSLDSSSQDTRLKGSGLKELSFRNYKQIDSPACGPD